MSEVLSATNLKFLAQGMWTTLYLSFFIIVLSTLFGTILAVMRNGKNPILSTLDKRKPACLKDLTTDKSLFILSSHKLFVKCYHLSFLSL